jgi:UDP-N-acetyl-D-mannosaminuronate dehydrogenase
MSHGRNAAAFARAGSPVTGFDIDVERVRELQAGRDRICEVDAADLNRATLNLTCDKAGLRRADFLIRIRTIPLTSEDSARLRERLLDAWSMRTWRKANALVSADGACVRKAVAARLDELRR